MAKPLSTGPQYGQKKLLPLGMVDERVRRRSQPLATNRSRNGLSTNRANPTTAKFMIAVNTNTRCQPPLADLIRLATGTRNADAPFAVDFSPGEKNQSSEENKAPRGMAESPQQPIGYSAQTEGEYRLAPAPGVVRHVCTRAQERRNPASPHATRFRLGAIPHPEVKALGKG